MERGEFADAALVLVGHGSTLNGDSSAPTYQHCDTLRERGVFGEVIECFWKLEPSISSVLRSVAAERVFVVPFFISEGYFTEEVIPRELGMNCAPPPARLERVQRVGAKTVHYCGPVGTHTGMTDVLLARARGVVEAHPPAPDPAQTALLIAGHGTGINDNSRKAVEAQADLIRARSIYGSVQAVFMEEDPRIERCYEFVTEPSLVIVPFFISDGLHSFEDIPVLLGEEPADVRRRYEAHQPTWINPTERHGKRVWYSASIGGEPAMADVILERVRQMAAASTVPA